MVEALQLPSFSITSLIQVARFFSDFEGTCLLLSQGNSDVEERSFLGLFPFESVSTKDNNLNLQRLGKIQSFRVDNSWTALESHF